MSELPTPLRNGVVPAIEAELAEARAAAVRFARVILDVTDNPFVDRLGDEPCEGTAECSCVECSALRVVGRWG